MRTMYSQHGVAALAPLLFRATAKHLVSLLGALCMRAKNEMQRELPISISRDIIE